MQEKDEIKIYNINFLVNKHKKKTEKYQPTKKDLKFSSDIFIENNENFVVINKPAGIAVQSGTKSRKNILDILIIFYLKINLIILMILKLKK